MNSNEKQLFLSLQAEDTFATAMQRLKEFGAETMHVVATKDDKPAIFFCLTGDPELAARLKKTAEEYVEGC